MGKETIGLAITAEAGPPEEAGCFCRRIGNTLYRVRVFTGAGHADTLPEKISRMISNEVVTGTLDYVNMASPQTCRPPERSSA